MQRKEASLEEILRSREERAAEQKRLLQQGNPVISFTMNIPGPVKDTPLIRFAFRAGLGRLRRCFGEAVVERSLCSSAGCQAVMAYARPAEELKAACMEIEEEGEIGRLYDLDVLDLDGRKLSRSAERRCLVCGGPVMVCSRSRAHGLAALTACAEKRLREFAAAHLADLAEEALLEEVWFTPKPGLVDRRNTGAHRDMDLDMFCRSARVLRPFFQTFAALGMDGAPPARLQAVGVAAEAEMFAATGGVNTHKGAVYSLALLLSSAGALLLRDGNLFAGAARTAAAIPAPVCTNGSAVRKRYGIGGVREEAAEGYPTLRGCWRVLEEEDALTALLWSMAHLEDTNLYHRGGAEGAAFVRQAAADILAAPPQKRAALARKLDGQLIRRNLSPGGSADLLALAIFLQKAARLLEPESLAPAGEG